MKMLYLIICFFIVTTAYSQDRLLKKFDKLYTSGNYDKCIKKAKRNKSTENNPAVKHYLILSYIGLYKASKNKSEQYSLLKKSITEYTKLLKNQDSQNPAQSGDSLHTLLNQIAVGETSDKPYSVFIHKQLALLFNDTTEYYRKKFLTQPDNRHSALKIPEKLDNNRKILLQSAEHVIGAPYKYGGTDSTGFDCSGFTQYVYKKAGIELPHNADMQSKIGETITIEEALPGDLIFFGNKRAYHAGIIYANNNGNIELIHCVSGGVSHQDSNNENTKYWLKNIYQVKRVLPEELTTDK